MSLKPLAITPFRIACNLSPSAPPDVPFPDLSWSDGQTKQSCHSCDHGEFLSCCWSDDLKLSKSHHMRIIPSQTCSQDAEAIASTCFLVLLQGFPMLHGTSLEAPSNLIICIILSIQQE